MRDEETFMPLPEPVVILAAVALGEDGTGARLLARVAQKSWEELGFARGQSVFAQVKSVALGRADVPE